MGMEQRTAKPVMIDEAWARDTQLIPGGFRMMFDPPVTPEVGRFRIERMGAYLSWLVMKIRRSMDIEPGQDMEAQIDQVTSDGDLWTSAECSLHPYHNYT
jgi:hypothetical protein